MLRPTKKTLSCLDEDTIPNLHKGLVSPYLEHGNIIWHPRYQMEKMSVEEVQCRANKLVAYLKHLGYE